MPSVDTLDEMDIRLLLALQDEPRATVVALAERVGLSRNTVQARLTKLERRLRSFERRIDPAALGYPLTAFITVQVTQQMLGELTESMAEIPEVVEVFGLTGATDLLVRVVAVDADDLYRIAGQVLATPGVERTNFALAMRSLVDYRVAPLLNKALTDRAREV
ncbi:Lrp/AsnC family transcriptional regulator [Saccharopolyspora spinosa]|uniref:DNA-binding Lrp family transcriptional regulator n=1 Tax=Saccharopolyspora spinosa TaxID=60894 RepID=A0A2N3Y7A3_SACSN|nr:Lrp/AsnC family transcriptional regulator [Saccharopolyspora spinosa]PKW18814.1 DNA-binding Lrp family transcriptional regulator [Saccharopolyspora spinosa]